MASRGENLIKFLTTRWRHVLFAAAVVGAIVLSLIPGGMEIGYELSFVALVGTSLVASLSRVILLVNLGLGLAWILCRLVSVPQWLHFHVLQINRAAGHAEALLGWLTVAMVACPFTIVQVPAAAAIVLFGGPMIDRLARRFSPKKAEGDLLWARRPYIYIATLLSLIFLVAMAPAQWATLMPLGVAIGCGMVLRYFATWLRARSDVELERRAALEQRAANAKWLDVGVVVLVLGLAAITPAMFLARSGRSEDAKSRAPICQTADAATFVSDLSVFLISDSQFHEVGGARDGAHLDLADSFVPVAVRPIELDLLSEATLLHFRDLYRTLKAARPNHDMSWAHIGDFGDLACQSELARLKDVFAAYNAVGDFVGLVPGNHDSAYLGNFDWHPDWGAACKSGRLEKSDSDSALAKLVDDKKIGIVQDHKPANPVQSAHGYLSMVSRLGVAHDALGDHTVIGIFADTSDRGAFEIGIAGLVGSVSEGQVAALAKAALPLIDPKQVPYYVIFLHHPFDDLDGRGQKNLEGLMRTLGGRVLALVSAHTHLSARLYHAKLGNLPEYVLGSTIDPPQEAATLEIGHDDKNQVTVRVETIPSVSRTQDLICADRPVSVNRCNEVLSALQSKCDNRPGYKWLDTSETETPETGDDENLIGALRYWASENGHPGFPSDVKKEQHKRGKKMLACLCENAVCAENPPDPLDDAAVFPFLMAMVGKQPDELTCISWAASIVQAYKHTSAGPHTIAEALGHLSEHRDEQVLGAKLWVDRR